VTFEHPGWFLLAIPLAAALWYWRLPSRLLTGLRLAIFALVLLALCGAALRLPSRAGTVVVVADRSASMPADASQREAEAIGLLAESHGRHDRLAVVTFGRKAVVELAPGGGTFGGFTAEVDPHGSNLAAAVRRAVALVPEGAPGRLLVLSDGRHTGADPVPAAFRAAAREVAVDYRLLGRPSADDVAILHLDAPRTVTPEESFLIHAWVRSPVRQTVRYELARGKARIASGERAVASGVTRLTFRTQARGSGTADYTARVEAGRPDPVPENNRARVLVGVRGPRPLLLVTETPEGGLARLLAGGGLEVDARRPTDCDWSVAALSNYAGLLLENVPAGDIGETAMARLAAWVTETGSGLMLTGGKQAYGPGGYYKSPLEPVMPVSMELRKEHRKLALAIVVAMDRSGSMAMEASGGRTKMDLANLAAAEVVDLLSEMDEFGCVAVDSAAHVVAPLEAVENKSAVQHRIRSVEAMGGGIFVYEALSAAARMLTGAASGTRHIILFADAADSEQPGQYKALLEKCEKANITVSIVGLGTPQDTDADLLRDIAKRGQGRCMFTTRPEELPRLFAQDTFVVARSAFLDEVTPVRPTGAMRMLAGRTFADLPAVGGYNLCYLRPEANLAAVTRDEYEAPLVAAWNTGAGRVLCYTGQADGPYTGPMAAWPEVGNFLTSLAKWTAGPQEELPGGMLLVQEVGDDLCRVALHLDPDRDAQPFDAVPTVSTLRGRPGGTPETHRGRMRWEDPDTLVLDVPLRGEETALSSVRVPGVGRFTLPPVCLPYSAEFKPAEEGRGRETLERLARATGGVERADLPLIWDALPSRPQRIPLVPWLLTAAVVLFLLEVLERRTGLLASAAGRAARLRPRRRRPAAEEEEGAEGTERREGEPSRPAPEGKPEPARPGAGPTPAEAEAPPPKAAPDQKKADLGSVLRKARHRADRRTERKDDG
jgi:hypothetical protein